VDANKACLGTQRESVDAENEGGEASGCRCELCGLSPGLRTGIHLICTAKSFLMAQLLCKMPQPVASTG
jgi:hypothetical protein